MYPVHRVYDGLETLGVDGALFTSKDEFALFDRSWPSIDTFHVDTDNGALMAAAIEDVTASTNRFHFIHLSAPDVAGHSHGWMSRPYRRAVLRTDRLLGDLVGTIRADATLAASTVLVVTADHGGRGLQHGDTTRLVDYRVPFLVGGGRPARCRPL